MRDHRGKRRIDLPGILSHDEFGNRYWRWQGWAWLEAIYLRVRDAYRQERREFVSIPHSPWKPTRFGKKWWLVTASLDFSAYPAADEENDNG